MSLGNTPQSGMARSHANSRFNCFDVSVLSKDYAPEQRYLANCSMKCKEAVSPRIHPEVGAVPAEHHMSQRYISRHTGALEIAAKPQPSPQHRPLESMHRQEALALSWSLLLP